MEEGEMIHNKQFWVAACNEAKYFKVNILHGCQVVF